MLDRGQASKVSHTTCLEAGRDGCTFRRERGLRETDGCYVNGIFSGGVEEYGVRGCRLVKRADPFYFSTEWRKLRRDVCDVMASAASFAAAASRPRAPRGSTI